MGGSGIQILTISEAVRADRKNQNEAKVNPPHRGIQIAQEREEGIGMLTMEKVNVRDSLALDDQLHLPKHMGNPLPSHNELFQ